MTEFGKTRESLGRRARGSSSAAPAFRTIRRRPATGLDERSKKSEGKRRKPPLGKPDRPGRNGNPTAGPKPANRFHPSEPEHGRRFPRSRHPQSKSKCAGDEDRAAPRRRDGRGRSAKSEFRPDRRVFLPSSSLARIFRSRPENRDREPRGRPSGDARRPKTLPTEAKATFRKNEPKNLRDAVPGRLPRRACVSREVARPWEGPPPGRRTPWGNRRCRPRAQRPPHGRDRANAP